MHASCSATRPGRRQNGCLRSEPAPHSSDQFGPHRDFWWNPDFLELMARRWRLSEAGSMADIGCGLGHWGRLLYPYLQSPAKLTGVDREPRWIAQAPERFRCAFPDATAQSFTFVCGDAERIPLPDDSFDVVTCQTLLMHLVDPLIALREMLRILRPGGRLICVEPNNLWNFLSFNSLTAAEPVERIVRRFEFWLRYHRGKIVAGEGDNTVGDLLPGWFVQLGLGDITVHQSDRAAALFPPYNTPAQQALIAAERQWHATQSGPYDCETLRQHVLSGGGTPEFFAAVLPELNDQFDREQRAIADGTFHAANGSLFYLVSGRKA